MLKLELKPDLFKHSKTNIHAASLKSGLSYPSFYGMAHGKWHDRRMLAILARFLHGCSFTVAELQKIKFSEIFDVSESEEQ